MKLHKIELTNFRQFKGTQSIIFSYNPKKNVTVIYGENGRGKTGIFRALMFCLYGDKSLSQDELTGERKKKGLYLVNEVALKQNTGSDIEASVSVEFSHRDEIINIKRSISGVMKKSDEIIQDTLSKVQLQVTDSNGNSNPPENDPDKIKSKIQEILNFRLRDYFLFDGERIERLTRSTQERREEVRKGIRILLDLDAMELAIKSLDKMISKIEKEIKFKSTGQLKEVTERIDDLTTNIDDLKDKFKDNNQEIRRLEVQIKNLSKEIADNKETADLETKRHELIDNQEEKRGEREQLKREIGYNLNKSSQLVASELIDRFHEELDTYRQKGELPPGIRRDFVEKLLQDGNCICGNSIGQENSTERQNLIKFMEKTFKPGLGKLSEDLFHKLGALSSSNELLSKEFNRLLMNNKTLNDSIDDLDSKIQSLSDQLGKGGTSIDSLIKEREKCEKERDEIIKESAIQDNKIKKGEQKREELRKEAEKLTKREKHLEILDKKKEITVETLNKLKTIYDEFAKNVKINLAEKSTENFSILADDETLKDIKTIHIDDNYMLDVINWAGQRRLGEISAGQRQIVSLSFIMSLIQVANNLEVPLFMDTPFGRLSGRHRDHLIEKIPNMASQWVLLATDTEFTETEAKVLRNTNSWGKVYELNKEVEGFTKIMEKNVDQFVPHRKSII